MAIDRRNERFGELGEEGKREGVWFFSQTVEVIRFYISADTKCPVPRTSENTDAQRGIIAKLTPDLGEYPIRFTIAGIEPLWTVDRHVRQWAFFFEQDFHVSA